MTAIRKNLIVSTDDFGISPLANANILALAEAGKLDRVSVMTIGNFSSSEIERLKKTGVKLDIHLDLASKINAKRKLSDGVFLRGIKFVFNYLRDLISSDSKKSHWEKQLQKFHAIIGRYPDGINSHEHIHFFPAYFKIIIALAAKNNIDFVRFGKKSLVPSFNPTYFILRILHKIDIWFLPVQNFNSSDYAVSLDWIKNIPKFLKNLPEGKTEIVCHPERQEEFELIQKYF